MSYQLLLFLHVLSSSVWLGAGLTFMVWSRATRGASLEVWAHTWIVLARLQRAIVAPSSLIAFLTGLMMLMSLMQRHYDLGGAAWLMAMQVLGFIASLLTLLIVTPLVGRMNVLAVRSLEQKAQDPSAEAARKRIALVGTISGLMIVAAMYFGAARPVF